MLKNENSILIPNKEILGKQLYIQDIVSRVLKINNLSFTFVKSWKKKVNNKNIIYYLIIKLQGKNQKRYFFQLRKKISKKTNFATSN